MKIINLEKTLGFLQYLTNMDDDGHAITFDRLKFLIFDEADELFATNFEKGIFRFLQQMKFLREIEENKFVRNQDFDDVRCMTFAADDSFEKCAKGTAQL